MEKSECLRGKNKKTVQTNYQNHSIKLHIEKRVYTWEANKHEQQSDAGSRNKTTKITTNMETTQKTNLHEPAN